MASRVIYTAILGGYDRLNEPKFVPEDTDFVCFTDQKLKSKRWQIREVSMPIENDTIRSARMYKTLPHRYLGSYEYSTWVDGNLLVRGDTNKLIEQYLTESNLAIYDHESARHMDKDRSPNERCSPFEEARVLIDAVKNGKAKYDVDKIEQQIAYYKRESMPEDTGIPLSMVVVRKHNEPDVIRFGELWWDQIKKFSRRDQISFNYAAWKTRLQFVYIKENARENEFVLWKEHA